jgi:hypothetical protein
MPDFVQNPSFAFENTNGLLLAIDFHRLPIEVKIPKVIKMIKT